MDGLKPPETLEYGSLVAGELNTVVPGGLGMVYLPFLDADGEISGDIVRLLGEPKHVLEVLEVCEVAAVKGRGSRRYQQCRQYCRDLSAFKASL